MDYLPIGEARLLFFLVWQQKIRVWQASHDAKEGPPRDWEYPPAEPVPPVYNIPTEWAEPFYVMGSAPDFLFVTESGRLYGWHKAGLAKQEMIAHWQSARRIRTLITDAETGKTWAFAAADPGTLKLAPVYFLLDNEAGIRGEPTEYTLPKAEGERLPAAVRDLLPYVKILQDNGAIATPKDSKIRKRLTALDQ